MSRIVENEASRIPKDAHGFFKRKSMPLDVPLILGLAPNKYSKGNVVRHGEYTIRMAYLPYQNRDIAMGVVPASSLLTSLDANRGNLFAGF
jgi:hypothetical protein